ncbi:hypothetical protein O6H91_07G115000 [Diphasiastrum complanatum]|uniref:Uncharacterized protein n=2 Tax=Diphasiastrum complanatum TaxID=34168 RepID=A0ACC2D9A6_DIPCM|nr:hypothetical protein O6H91_07G115000 [Diphasiastrum complanatum]KAJ7550734.1 hypothetical protein O6H91_07G115000 [Diphasiastrum complanatum]
MGWHSCDEFPPLKRIKLLEPCHTAVSQKIVSLKEAAMARSLPAKETTEETIGSNCQIRKIEFVRIITQALYSLGYDKAAALVEEESGICLQSEIVSQLRSEILQGSLDDSIATLYKLGLDDSETIRSAAFLILEQKFLEQLRKGELFRALETLRYEISPLHLHTQRVHELASYVVCPRRMKFLEKGGINCAGENARFRLLQKLQNFLPPTLIIPEKRLEHLVEQALNLQREACIFHNSLDDSISLYSDHCCSRDQIPTQTLQVLEVHENEVWFLQFSHDGKYLASASKDCTAVIWEVVDAKLVKLKHTLTGHKKPVSFVAWSPDNAMLLTCGTEEVVKLWDVRSGECKQTYEKAAGGFTSCAWFPSGNKFFCAGGDKGIYIWDLSGKEIDSWKGLQMPRINDMAVTLDGSVIVCRGRDIKIYNLEEKTERIIEAEEPITALSVSNDGRYLLVNLANQEIHLWDITSSCTIPCKYKGHRQGRYVIRSCFGGSDNAFIVSGSEDSQIYIWHRGSGRLLDVLPGHSGTVNSVSWNPTNPYMFASASDDHTIRIWGLKNGSNRTKGESSSNGVCHLLNGEWPEKLENSEPL